MTAPPPSADPSPPPEPRSDDTPPRRLDRLTALAPQALFEAGFAAVTLGMAAPAWAARHLPLQDLPQHLAAISVLRRLLFSGSLDATFEATLSRTQYLLVYGLGVPLSALVGVASAGKLIVTLTVVSLPYALRFLLRRMGRDERLAALSWPLLWNPQMLLGFLNFLLGVPIALVALGLLLPLDAPRSRGRELALAALSLAAFYAHLIPYGVLGLGSLLLLRAPSPWGGASSGTPAAPGEALRAFLGAAWRHLRFLVPSLAAVLLWALRTPAAQESVRAGGVGVRPRPEWPALASLPRELSGTLLEMPGDLDERALLGWMLAVLGLVALAASPSARGEAAASPRRSRLATSVALALPALALTVFLVRHRSFAWVWGAGVGPAESWAEVALRGGLVAALGALLGAAVLGGRAPGPPDVASGRLAWLPVACAGLYLCTPASYGWIWPIHTRFAVTAALLAPLLLARVRAPRAVALLGVMLGALSLGLSVDLAARFAQWDAQELGDLDESLAHAAPGRRLVALTPAQGSGLVPNVPLLHSAAYYQALRGGAVATFSFADFPQSPFRYREGATRPPRLPPRWEWNPDLDVADPDRSYYDYVLVRRGGNDAPGREPTRYERVHDGLHWTLYARRLDASATPPSRSSP